MLSFDRLHANHEGMFGDHLWIEFKNIVAGMGHAAAVEIEKRYATI